MDCRGLYADVVLLCDLQNEGYEGAINFVAIRTEPRTPFGGLPKMGLKSSSKVKHEPVERAFLRVTDNRLAIEQFRDLCVDPAEQWYVVGPLFYR